jgi:hypothetical protein
MFYPNEGVATVESTQPGVGVHIDYLRFNFTNPVTHTLVNLWSGCHQSMACYVPFMDRLAQAPPSDPVAIEAFNDQVSEASALHAAKLSPKQCLGFRVQSWWLSPQNVTSYIGSSWFVGNC